jgi:hypothetical protein
VARSGGDAALGLAPFVTISWAPPLDDGGAEILGYTVEMKDANNAAADWTVIYDGSTRPDAREFKYQDGAALTAGQTYSFRTYSRNVKGVSPASDAIDITAATIPEKMAAPTRVAVVIDSATLATEVEIAWLELSAAQSGGAPVTGYRIRRNNGYGTSLQEAYVDIADPATLSHTFTAELLIGVTYEIVIAAVNDVVLSNSFELDGSAYPLYSEPLELTVANLPEQVTGLHQPTDNYRKGTIRLAWAVPSTFETVGNRVGSYTILKDVGSGVFYALAQVSGSTLEYTDTGLVPGQAYSYKVYASNVIGDGPESAVLTGTAGQEPGKVERLFIVTESSTSLVFGWDNELIEDGGLPITGYLVSMDGGDFVYDDISEVDAPADSFTYAVTQPGNEGRTYRFRVAAVNALGTGVTSDEIQLVATDAPDPPTLTLLESTRTLHGFQLSFGRPASDGGSALIGYLLYRDEGIAGSPFTLIHNGTSQPEVATFIVEGLETALTYRF